MTSILLDVVANPVTAVDVKQIHHQIGLVLHFAAPITIPFVDGAGNPRPSKSLTSFGVQSGAQEQRRDAGTAVGAERQPGARRLELLPRFG